MLAARRAARWVAGVIPPPVFPDVVHVANGCYISAVVYAARYRAAYPGEQAEVAAIPMTNAGGLVKPHTLAIMSWRGGWWARDEYYGVIDLREPSVRPWNPAAVRRRAEASSRRRYARLLAGGAPARTADAPPSGRPETEWRLDQVEAARRLLPVPSELHWLRTGSTAVPLLYFRPRPNSPAFAVYDPASGTASAEAAVRDSAQLVAAVARRLGYAPEAEPLAAADRPAAAAIRTASCPSASSLPPGASSSSSRRLSSCASSAASTETALEAG